MRDVWSSVKQTMNTMATVAPNNAETVRLSVFLYNITNLAIFFTRFNNIYCFGKTLVSNFDKFLYLRLDITDQKSLVKITVKTVVVNGNVNVANITVLQRPGVWYTVAYNFVNRSATASWKLVIIHGRRVTVPLYTSLVHRSVYLSCSNSDVTDASCLVEYLSSELKSNGI